MCNLQVVIFSLLCTRIWVKWWKPSYIHKFAHVNYLYYKHKFHSQASLSNIVFCMNIKQYYNLRMYDVDWNVMGNVENMSWDDLLCNQQTWQSYGHLGLWCPFAIALIKQMCSTNEATSSCCRGTFIHFGIGFESNMKLLDMYFNKSFFHINPWCSFNILGRTTLGSCSHG